MKKGKYLFVNTHFAPDYHFGGVVASGSKLYKYLSCMGAFGLATVSSDPARISKTIFGSSCYRSILLHRFAFSIDAIYGLWQNLRHSDVALINGIFTFPVTLAALYAVILKKPFIVATRGGLEPWSVAQKKWKKYFYIKYVTFPLMKRARYVHVTSAEEAKNVRALGFSNVINIPNGIDAEDYQELPGKFSSDHRYDGKFVFLFLSRTDKEKGIDILLVAYRDFRTKFGSDGHLLIIAGPDNQSYLKNMSLDYNKENIERLDGVYGEEKTQLIRRSDVMILPSYSENFGNIVAEGLACERPVITTTGTPWKEIETIGCGLYIKPEAGELYQAMKTMYLKSPEEREEMGRKGRKYILENFNWETKAREIFKYLEEIGQQ